MCNKATNKGKEDQNLFGACVLGREIDIHFAHYRVCYKRIRKVCAVKVKLNFKKYFFAYILMCVHLFFCVV
jgi:hypothetical protein